MSKSPEDILTNTARPATDATLTVRIIKSLRFRTEKSLVLHNIDLTSTTVAQLKSAATQAIASQPGWKPYRSCVLDTLKLYTKAHGAKTSNLIINLDHEEWILDNDDKTLAEVGLGESSFSLPQNESEVSFFSRKDYEDFKLNPE
ncbi:hypothetical protein HYPSUDRAFT_115237, partial [Hypholoma sublateritium FD-334 SS-4]